MEPKIKDVRAQMPNYNYYKDWQRSGPILGVTVHHSATANRITGSPIGDAATFFNYHVNTRGWAHGGYNYVITAAGEIEYALDDKIAAYHAGFKDPDNSEGLEYGQYWNNHYLAVCLAGWFSENRTYRDAAGRVQRIPDNHIAPTAAQMEALVQLVQHLHQKYNIPVENVRGHRELAGNSTRCPGLTFDPAQLRQQLRQAEQPAEPEPEPGLPTEVAPGQHVLLLPDTDKYLDAAMAYIWHFQPDATFAGDEAVGRWQYVTAVGNESDISNNLLERLRSAGAKLVQRIPGSPAQTQDILDGLVAKNQRFLTEDLTPTEPEPEPEVWPTYTIQPGDSLSRIARQFYGKSHLWRIIFENNQHILADPGQIRPGQVLKIPPSPEPVTP